MALTPQQKEHIQRLLRENRQSEAVKYLVEEFGLALREARLLVDTLQKQQQEDPEPLRHNREPSSASPAKKSGCIGLVGKLFMTIGVVLLGSAVYLAANKYDTLAGYQTVTGKVVDTPAQPVVEYNVGGETYSIQAAISSNPPSYHLGEEVQIRVNPQDPYDAIMDSFWEKYLISVILAFMSLFFLLPGVIFVFVVRKLNFVVQHNIKTTLP